jgi:hypothetical protein
LHKAHEEELTRSLKYPTLQSKQELESSRLYVPDEQPLQDSVGLSEKKPPLHTKQEDAPLEGATLPEEHIGQLIEPSKDANRPFPHSSHVDFISPS